MPVKALVTLIQQSQRTLDNAGFQLIQEANKKIAETKHKIDSESSIKQMMMDEITSNGPELVCSIETKNRIDSVYNKLKSKNVKLKNNLDKSNENLINIGGKLTNVEKLISKIEGIFKTLRRLIPSLKTIIQACKVALKFLKHHPYIGPYGLNLSDGHKIVKLHLLIEKSEGKIKEIDGIIKVMKVRVAEVRKSKSSIAKIHSTAITAVSSIKNKTNSSIGLIESYYLKHTLMCNVEGDSMEDEDFAAAVNDAQNNLNNTLGNTLGNAEVTLIKENLLPNTITRIRNANFQVIQYRIT